jgi:drug/metabolite transporter (DMT)-like permease
MQNRPLAAAGVILSGMAIIGFIDQFLRIVAEGSSLWSFHLIRTAMMVVLVTLWLLITRTPVRARNWRGVIARSAIMSTAMIIYFGALAFMPVAQAAAGLFTSPIWVLVFSAAFFGLKIGPRRVLAVGLGFAGILMVLSPDPATMSPVVFLPVVAGAFYAVAMIATREWCPQEGVLTLSMGIFLAMAVWGLGGIIVIALWAPEAPAGAAGFLLRGWVTPTPQVVWWCFVQAAGSLCAVMLVTRGYQLAEASYAAVFEYSVLIFSAAFGFWVWGDSLGPVGWLGLVCIMAAGSIIALRGRAAE